MRFYYCDSCFLISSYQKDYFEILSQYKEMLFVSRSQVIDELIKPAELKEKVIKSITIIEENDLIRNKAFELKTKHIGLSFYDCLCLGFGIIDGYTLVSDDKALINTAKKYNINTISCEELIIILKTNK